jgi:pyruvate dehydrogenase E2 component (dihydrolipoamide acetyltransferase)
MAVAITVPRLGWNMDQGVFLGWLRRDGEAIRAGDPLFALESEKAAQDIEANESGILRIAPDAPTDGAVVAVGTVIGYLLAAGESDPALGKASVLREGEAPPEPAFREGEAPPEPVSTTSAARQEPRPLAVDGLGARTRVASRRGDRPRISPLARRLARELGVDWTRLVGSGCTGRIRKVDILAAASTSAGSTPRRDGSAVDAKVVPIGATRRTIAARMVQSRQATAPVTLHATADATNLVSLRTQYKAAASPGREVPGFLEFVVKLTAMTLRDHPMLHARWDEDRLIVPDQPQIGIAVDTDDGLLVPVIRGAAGLGLGEIVAQARDLARRARDRRIRPHEMQGGTFTITNLGAFGVEAFTPIINPPECAVLGLGRVARHPVMIEDRVVGRDRMGLSLTFDHRIVDGAPAARFLRALVGAIENPAPWLIT